MSADNFVGILQTKDGFRVAECRNMESIGTDRFGANPKWNEAYITGYFRHCFVFNDEGSAYDYAEIMADDIEEDGGYLEYGIEIIEEFKDLDFPT